MTAQFNTGQCRPGPDLRASQRGQSVAEPLCPVCGSASFTTFFEHSEIPVTALAFCKTRARALNCSKGDIRLALCGECGAVCNLAFDPSRVAYDSGYDNSLHFSPTFQSYAANLARQLIDAYDLHGRDVVEVGCGTAEFLAMVCGLGSNRGIGFDPSFTAGRADMHAGQGITVLPQVFQGPGTQYAADFFICRHVLEHIWNPRAFLRTVHASLKGRSPGALFCEVPNASLIFRKNAIWDIIYEHCFYYTPGSLMQLFAGSGFDVLHVFESFEHQFLCLEARTGSPHPAGPNCRSEELASLRCATDRFHDQYRSYCDHWEQILRRFAAEGKRVALWGAGAKGVMFLNTFQHIQLLNNLIDVNPHKWGLYVPGTGHEVVPPTSLCEYRPEVVLIANSIYVEEISRQLAALGLAPALMSI